MSSYPKLPRRLIHIFPDTPVFFVTFCTEKRKRLLAIDAVHTAFCEFANNAYADHNVAVGRYVIMPDHVHVFVRGRQDFQLGRWVGTLKQYLPRQIGRNVASPIWQRGFVDHVLRSDESYDQKWNYVRENPVRAGLTMAAEEWPYAGEITIIDRVQF